MRVRRGLSQRDLELASGIPIRTLQRLESGRLSSPPLGYLVNLALVLDVAVDELVEDDWLLFNEQLGWEDWVWKRRDPRGRRALLSRSC